MTHLCGNILDGTLDKLGPDGEIETTADVVEVAKVLRGDCRRCVQGR